MILVGDSITYGYQPTNPDHSIGFALNSTDANYPTVLWKLMGGAIPVGNFGYPGTTMQNGLPDSYTNNYLYTLALPPEVSAHTNQAIVIELGTNDSKPVIWSNNNNTFLRDCQSMVRGFLAYSTAPQVWLNTVPPVRMPTNDLQIDLATITGSINPLIRQCAASFSGVNVIDVYAKFLKPDGTVNLEYLSTDGAHPNDAGYSAIAQAVYEAIKGEVK